ncbi:pimeloyl-ACP methyl ester carboxylesterase [Arthrobacter pigmenti]|uniref:Pimeloyl-ACP methyl ester carboxylesterase n=1 Tax=Arthrobacter pigmenti TaxID=271432 RepID=A0A846RT71_9MICC|nr:epoxide hydrolase family protein [Arthrobacter pigmenti]NJC23694.1 pimeloyl-ACP methyl ester carboxylesterase [Arthrobacter pigmenti]
MTTSEIVPFTIRIPQDEIDDLRRRLAAARVPASLPPTVNEWGASSEWDQGVPQSWLAALADYWRDGFDWRAYEQRLNDIPQFTTRIDGQTMHFVHVRSEDDDAVPLLLAHGWPGSFLEFVDLIGPLTAPERHGRPGGPAFHVVVPSAPGFAFSSPLADGGWDDSRIADAYAELMSRLGYEQFGVQGGDFGAGLAPEIARRAPGRVMGIHVNGTTGPMPQLPLSEEEAAALTDRERQAIKDIEAFMWQQFGYISIQSTRPGLIGTMLTDSPTAQLAWIMDKFQAWTWPVEQDVLQILDRDLLLANVSLYWFTRTAGSAALTVYAQGSGWGTPKEKTSVPTAVLNFAHDIAIRSYVERENTVTRWTDVDHGGHFAALEEPDLLVEDLRAFFSTLAKP